MSNVNGYKTVEIELEDFEKNILIQASRILQNTTNDMWNEDLEDTDEAYKAENARDSLKDFLKNCLGIDSYDEE